MVTILINARRVLRCDHMHLSCRRQLATKHRCLMVVVFVEAGS